MTRIFLSDHHRAGTIEKFRPMLRKLAGPLRNLAEQLQGERVPIEGAETPTFQVIQDASGVDSGKPVRQKGTRVVVRKRLEMQQSRSRSVVVLDLDTVCGASPVGFSAGEDERRVAHLRELPQDGIDRSSWRR